MIEPLSVDEKMILKTAAFGAVALVSNADPGLFAMIKESFAASDVLTNAIGMVKDAFSTGGLPELPHGSSAELEAVVLPMLRRAVWTLRSRAPQEVENYRAVVLAAVERVAQASEGGEAAEQAMIEKVKAALVEDD